MYTMYKLLLIVGVFVCFVVLLFQEDDRMTFASDNHEHWLFFVYGMTRADSDHPAGITRQSLSV